MIHLQKQALPYREPQSVFGALFGQDPHAIWLDSASLTNKAPYSYMARPTVLLKANQSPYLQVTELQTPLLEIQWPSRLTMSDLIPLMNTHRHSESKGPPFQGGLMGFMAYEYAHFLDTPIPYQTHTCDDLYWLWIEDFYYWDHEQQHCYAMAIGHDPTQVQKRVTSLTQNYHNACKNPFKVPQKAKRGPIRTHTPKSVYLDKITDIKALIRAGESYEICLSNEFHFESRLPALDAYQHLRQFNPAPYSCFIQTPDYQLLSSSPECFFDLSPSGEVNSYPIKGTRSQSENPIIQAEIERALLNSEKDNAELLMITDLIRHDLRKACTQIEVPELKKITQYAQVTQLSSHIRGQLKPGTHALNLLEELFPGGSITGAPKYRSTEIIHQYENRARDIFCGSIGYISLSGHACFNLAIRTALCHQEQYYIGAGGAIVADSDPELEWQELCIKADSLMKAF